MGGRREAFWINVAAGVAVLVVVTILTKVFDLGGVALLAVTGFLVLYALLAFAAHKFVLPRLLGQESRREDEAVRLRLADPPDESKESHLDWPHLSITNDTEDNLAVTVSAFWGQSQADLEWDPAGTGVTTTIGPHHKGTLPFVLRVRAGGNAWSYNGFAPEPGTCYVCDPVFLRSRTAGATLPVGRTNIRVEAQPTGKKKVVRIFDVYVPRDHHKPLWVVPRGPTGSE